jgi:hypothetical protein
VESAIEVILSLAESTQARPHWITAKEALYSVVDTRVPDDLVRAQKAFEDSLAKEGLAILKWSPEFAFRSEATRRSSSAIHQPIRFTLTCARSNLL